MVPSNAKATPVMRGSSEVWLTINGQIVRPSPTASNRYMARITRRRTGETSVIVSSISESGFAGSLGRGLGRLSRFAASLIVPEFQEVAGLARQRGADRFERREPNGARFSCLQDRKVRKRHAHAVGEF